MQVISCVCVTLVVIHIPPAPRPPPPLAMFIQWIFCYFAFVVINYNLHVHNFPELAFVCHFSPPFFLVCKPPHRAAFSTVLFCFNLALLIVDGICCLTGVGMELFRKLFSGLRQGVKHQTTHLFFFREEDTYFHLLVTVW